MLKQTNSQKKRNETYASSINAGDFLFMSFITHKGSTHHSIDESLHLEDVFDKIETIVQNSGTSLHNIVKCNVLLKNKNDFPECEDTLRHRFGNHFPVRTTFVNDFISPNTLFQIDAIAYRTQDIAV
jgi:enamine deaminase RidA (YjgF/YER057c/UK114 family)